MRSIFGNKEFAKFSSIVLVAILIGATILVIPDVNAAGRPKTPFNYSLTINPDTLTLSEGSSGSSTVNVVGTSGSATVSLSLSGIPAGVDANLSKTSGKVSTGSGFNSVLSVIVSNSAQSGTYNITVSGSGKGVVKDAILQLIVTAAPPGDPVIMAAGDIACDPLDSSYNGGLGTSTACRAKYTSDILVNAPDLAAVLTLGDNQYPNGELTKYNQSYDPTWGREKPSTYPVPGNHEYGTAGATGYYSYFGAAAGDPAKGYYSYDIGAWHIIALNSNCSAIGGCGDGSPQEVWLQNDLAAHSNTCTLTYWHHPRFSSGSSHGSNATYDAFWQDLYAAGADVVLAGHEHHYERFALMDTNGNLDTTNGIREFVVGSGGKSHYGFGTPLSASEVRNGDTFGVLKLTLHPDSYDWVFVAEAGKTFTDSGTSQCH